MAGIEGDVWRQEFRDSYVKELTPILRNLTKTLSMYYPAIRVGYDVFISTVDRFIDNTLIASLKQDF